MHFYQFYFLVLYVAGYVFFQFRGLPAPAWWFQAGFWAAWAFIVVEVYYSGRVIVDCLWLGARGQMTRPNVVRGILLAVLTFLPTLLMSVFLLKKAFA